MNPSLRLLSSLLLFCSCTSRHSADGFFHADQEHTGVYQQSDNKGFDSVRWKFQTGGKIYSSPVVIDDVVFTGSEDSCLYAVNTTDGHLKWKFKTGGPVSSTPAIHDSRVYLTSYDGFCYALDATTGKEIWRFKTEGERKVGAIGLWTMKPADMYMEDLWDFFLSSVVVSDETEPVVYFGSSDGNLYALDANTGKENWKFKTNGIIHSSPALYNGTVYFGSWDTYLYAVDARSGKEKWKFKTRDQPGYHVLEGIQASPAISDSLLYFGARDGFFYALNTETGSLIWNFPADNSWILTTAAIHEGTVYFGTSDTYLMYARDAKNGKQKWSMKANGYLYSSPSISGNTMYYGDFTGNMYALDLNSEGKKWQAFSVENRKRNAARILDQKGNLDFAFTAGTQDLSLYETSEDVMNEFYSLGSVVSSPCISGNVIYFGSADGNLYAVSLIK